MTQTSQHKDEGYTSPDFLANLFKKPLYSPISLSSIHSLSDQGSSNHYKENCSSPLLDSTNHSLKPKHENRTYRSLSIIDDEKIQSKKYKIFFKTLLHGRLSEEELNDMWRELQMSISNPFEFDKLIESIKAKRQLQIQKEASQKIKIGKSSQSIQVQVQNRSNTNEKMAKPEQTNQRYSSPQKEIYSQPIESNKQKRVLASLSANQKQLIKNEMTLIKSIIIKNERRMRQRPL